MLDEKVSGQMVSIYSIMAETAPLTTAWTVDDSSYLSNVRCSDGTYFDGVTCQPCISTCQSCLGAANKCLLCTAGKF